MAAGRATSVPAIAENLETRPLIHVHSGSAPPADAYSAVYYQDHWFWIDNDEIRSKRDFMFLMIFYALSETRAIRQAPVLTISAGQ